MGRTQRQLWLTIAVCSIAGVVLGGTTSRAAANQCFENSVVSSECLTQDPTTKTVQGMGAGLLAGAGAAIGATWQLWMKESR